MAYSSLRDFIDRLETDGRLVRVRTPVDTRFEITEIQTRLMAESGPAVLFENPRRPDGQLSPIPVLANLFGTVERVAWGMGREPDDLRSFGEQLAFLRQPEPPGGWREAVGMLPLLNRRKRKFKKFLEFLEYFLKIMKLCKLGDIFSV